MRQDWPLPDRPVPAARLALIDDVGSGIGTVNLPRSDIHRTSWKKLAKDGYPRTLQARAVCRTRDGDHGRAEHRKDQPTRV